MPATVSRTNDGYPSRLKILVIHQFFLAPGQPGGSRFNEFAKRWIEAGHEVTVIAGNLNYSTSGKPSRWRRRWIVREVEDGASILRCHVPTSYNRGYAGRAWSFLGFFLSSLTAVLTVGRPDVVVATSPPLTIGPTGWLAARWHRCPWVFEIRDLWPESAITTGVISRRGIPAKLLFALEAFCCRTSDRINVLTPAFRQDLIDRGLADAKKIVFVPNGADLDLFATPPRASIRRELGWDARFVALYAGVHGRANALMQLIEAAEALRDREDIVIATVGDGPERSVCMREADRRNLRNIVFLGPWAKEEMPHLLAAANAGLAVLQNNPTFRTVYPNKVFDYMAAGRAIVIAIDGIARSLVCDQAKAGMFVEPENGHAIADALRWLADHPAERDAMGSSGLAWARAHASRAAQANQYLDVLESIARPRRVE